MSSKTFLELLDAAGDQADSSPIPVGTYDFVVKTAEYTQAKSSGNDMYKIKAAIESGPHARRVVYNNFVITPDNQAALGMFFRNMNSLGLNNEFFKTNPSKEQVADALRGRRFRADIKIGEWQGNARNEVDRIYPPTSGSAPPAAPSAPQPPAPPVAASAPPAPPVAPAPPAPPVAAQTAPEAAAPAAPSATTLDTVAAAAPAAAPPVPPVPTLQ